MNRGDVAAGAAAADAEPFFFGGGGFGFGEAGFGALAAGFGLLGRPRAGDLAAREGGIIPG